MPLKIDRLNLMLGLAIVLSVFSSSSVMAAKVSFKEFCPQFVGQWAGDAAKAGEIPKKWPLRAFAPTISAS